MDRITKLQASLSALELDALLIQNPTDFFYLTGIQVSRGSIFLTNSRAEVIVDARYSEKCQAQSPFPVTTSNKSEMDDLLKWGWLSSVHRLGFDSAFTSVEVYRQWKHTLQETSLQLIGLGEPLSELRAIKDPEEIGLMAQAASLCTEGFEYLCTQLVPGISEIELVRLLEIFWLERGGEGTAFDPIVAFGANSSMPHYSPDNTVLEIGMPVLIDIGVTLHHYHSDMTRTLFLGDPSEEMRRIYMATLDAQSQVLNLCRPGSAIGDLDKLARDIIAKHGFAGKFTHSLGHGIGLDVHEYPILREAASYRDTPLAPGMVITIEPGVYVEGIGGVRIEDTIVITPDGHENLTSPQKDLIVIDTH